MCRDKKWVKCLVIFLLVADTVNAVFDLIYVYQSLVVHFGQSAHPRCRRVPLTSILHPGDAEYLTKANWSKSSVRS